MLPSQQTKRPWIYCCNGVWTPSSAHDLGRWLLFISKEELDQKWLFIRDLYMRDELPGVVAIKVSTRMDVRNDEGVIELYCEDSSDRDYILSIGLLILDVFTTDHEYIYYKTDRQGKGLHTYMLPTTKFNNCLL